MNWKPWKLIVVLLVTTGAAAAQGPAYPYSVGLTWTLSTSSGIANQNMYRSPYTTSCGAYTKLTTTPLSATATGYTDVNPAEGAYCYGVTATNAKGSESGLSNIDANVNIPPPPPTNLAATIAKNGTAYDVIYAWKNPPGVLIANTLYCGPSAPMRFIKIAPHGIGLRTYSVPPQSEICAVTATGARGESGFSNKVHVTVP